MQKIYLALISSPVPTAFLSSYADIALSNLLGTVSIGTRQTVCVRETLNISSMFAFSVAVSQMSQWSHHLGDKVDT